jgi:hypothetical protein
MHGPVNVKFPETAYGTRLVEQWAGVDQSSRKKKTVPYLTVTCSVWGVKPLCSCTRKLPCSFPFCLCNVLTIAEVLLIAVMLGFSHRTVLFGTDMLETSTTAVTVSSILNISLHVRHPGSRHHKVIHVTDVNVLWLWRGAYGCGHWNLFVWQIDDDIHWIVAWVKVTLIFEHDL